MYQHATDWGVLSLVSVHTGNDFSTLYAPLIRDGRMEKFYWEPATEDIINIVHQVGVH